MVSSRLAFVVIGAGCMAAAGVGGYLATRQSLASGQVAALTVDRPAATEPAGVSTAADATATGSTGVTRSEPGPPRARQSAEPGPARRSTVRAESAQARTSERVASSADAPRQELPPAIDDRQVTAVGGPAPSVADSLPAQETAPLTRTDNGPVLPEPAEPRFEELVVAADSVIGLQMARTIESDRARIEDRVEARVIRDVRVGGRVAIPAGTQALGSVMVVERGGKFRERARLGVRFHTLVLTDGTRLPLSTETIFRYGEAPGNGSAAKIGGGAVAGAILGAIIGGARGAAIGATSGAGAGTAVVMSGERSAAAFPAGTEMTARVLTPVSVTVEK